MNNILITGVGSYLPKKPYPIMIYLINLIQVTSGLKKGQELGKDI